MNDWRDMHNGDIPTPDWRKEDGSTNMLIMEQLTEYSLKKLKDEELLKDLRCATIVLFNAVKSRHGIRAAQEEVRVIEEEILRRLK